MKVPPVIPYTVGVFGVWLAYSAVVNVAPLGTLRSVLSGSGTWPQRDSAAGSGKVAAAGGAGTYPAAAAALSSPATRVTTGDGSSRPYSGTTSNVPVDHYDRSGYPVPVLVPVTGQRPGIMLAPVAADAFARWQAACGFPLVVQEAYRDIPGENIIAYSGHRSGEAVDLQQASTGIDAYAAPGTPTRARWEKLVQAARATGWANWTLDTAGRPRTDLKPGQKVETWHWSYNGRH